MNLQVCQCGFIVRDCYYIYGKEHRFLGCLPSAGLLSMARSSCITFWSPTIQFANPFDLQIVYPADIT